VIHKLTGRRATLGQTKQIHHTVETRLKQLKKSLAGYTTLALRDLKSAAELALQ
jgi:hypothetical protein